jgi:hypothetical protein
MPTQKVRAVVSLGTKSHGAKIGLARRMAETAVCSGRHRLTEVATAPNITAFGGLVF